ncbi:NIPSNAP protein [Singulisphaera sp. GP187]|uniref:NIPSNAP family protein n=1 Tax=Singulisphaera sp. GP187 TaxID=1882752 RepID=UPI00092B8922|nr:NIPSNAP family protein [Singulisphaera sp. GP187]SIO46451.1 NIPSNAP protein [Singulisphaera sp. GP187]
MIRALTLGLLLAATAASGFAAEPKAEKDKTVKGATEEECDCCDTGPAKVFELRTYYTNEGKLNTLNARFRDHTNRLFKKHGITIVGFWTPQDKEKGKEDTLVYLISFPSREAAAASWKAFQADPEWHKARDESEKAGKIIKKVESIYLDPTDYSPIK